MQHLITPRQEAYTHAKYVRTSVLYSQQPAKVYSCIIFIVPDRPDSIPPLPLLLLSLSFFLHSFFFFFVLFPFLFLLSTFTAKVDWLENEKLLSCSSFSLPLLSKRIQEELFRNIYKPGKSSHSRSSRSSSMLGTSLCLKQQQQLNRTLTPGIYSAEFQERRQYKENGRKGMKWNPAWFGLMIMVGRTFLIA